MLRTGSNAKIRQQLGVIVEKAPLNSRYLSSLKIHKVCKVIRNNVHAYELHWQLPDEKQQEAIGWLVENVPREQLSFIFPPYAKSCWQNAVKVVERIGYPENVAAFPTMVELFQDINWPGAEEAVQYFQTLPKEIVIPYMEAAGVKAKRDGDSQWLWFLYAVCDRLGIEHQDFHDGSLFDVMKYHYDFD